MRPRAIRPTPAVAAEAHTPRLRGTPLPFGSMDSRLGSTAVTGSTCAETIRLRTPYWPPSKTSSTWSWPPPVRQKAKEPRRGTKSGRKVASAEPISTLVTITHAAAPVPPVWSLTLDLDARGGADDSSCPRTPGGPAREPGGAGGRQRHQPVLDVRIQPARPGHQAGRPGLRPDPRH